VADCTTPDMMTDFSLTMSPGHPANMQNVLRQRAMQQSDRRSRIIRSHLSLRFARPIAVGAMPCQPNNFLRCRREPRRPDHFISSRVSRVSFMTEFVCKSTDYADVGPLSSAAPVTESGLFGMDQTVSSLLGRTGASKLGRSLLRRAEGSSERIDGLRLRP
jgi:hypothetical protein